MYPQGVCRIRKPAYADNGCAIFRAFETARIEEKIRCSAEDDLFRDSLISSGYGEPFDVDSAGKLAAVDPCAGFVLGKGLLRRFLVFINLPAAHAFAGSVF